MNFSVKAKQRTSQYPSTGLLFGITLVFAILWIIPAQAQVEQRLRQPNRTLPVRSDSVRIQTPPSATTPPDTSQTSTDSLAAPVKKKGDIETTILYSARDSINTSLDRKTVKLYGDAKVKYGEIELEADEIVIDYETSTITARSSLDSTGSRAGFPIFKNGAEMYETRDMMYNFKTKRARISEVVTTQGDGFLHGKLVYKNDRNELFSVGNAYTTCNLAHPHYRIIATKTKAIPDDKLVTGPFYMEFNDVPTPIGFIFGMFPNQRKSASGIMVPSYGEERRRGFFLRRGGYFFDINEYVKASVTGDIYSKGGSAVYLNSVYSKRYHYNGSFNFSFTNNVFGDNIEAPLKSKDFSLTWSHSPQSRGTGRFSASVNAATSTFNQNNFLGVNTNPNAVRLDNITRKMSSNVSYSKTFPGTHFSIGINMRHSQDLVTKQVDLPLPDLSFNMNNIYPFKKSQNSKLLENLNLRYTLAATNQITNNLGNIISETDELGRVTRRDSIAPFTFDNLSTFFGNAKRGMRHSIPLSTSFKLFKFFTASPSFDYSELWYFDKLNWAERLDDKGNREFFVQDTIKGFNRVSNYSISISLITRIYGTYLIKNPNRRVKAIRHIINPSIGFSMRPDFADPKFDYYQRFEPTDPNGAPILRARHQGFIYGASGSGKSSAINFGLNNNLEMKVKSAKDTVEKKISLFNTLSIGTSYNLAADSFKLANLGIAANTNILNDKINININATLDPYEYFDLLTYRENQLTNLPVAVITERRRDKLVWGQGRLGRITQAGLAFSTNLNPKARDKENNTRDRISKSSLPEQDKQYLLKNPDAYVDFTIPWSLRISYNVDYNRPISDQARITQAMRFSGDLSLTEKWKITFNSGYDFENNEFTQTMLSLNRELHCWQMSLGWTPFGQFQSYNFSIGVKSALLSDLKLDRTRSFIDNL